MSKHLLPRLAVLGGLFIGASAYAQDSAALINLLTRKGIINDQEAEDLRGELSKEFATGTSAGKLNLGSHLVEFKLGGDVRLRHQVETQAPALATGGNAVSNERTRERFRFRLNGDALLQKGWSAGFALETASAADSGNQTLQDGNNDYNIFLARAYVGYTQGTFSAFGGKFKNTLYTTDLRWDSDINPQGFTETYKFQFAGKDSLEIRALQNIMDDRAESTFGPAGRDAWLFEQQAVFTKYFGANSLILAPGFSAYNQSTLDGLDNETPWNGSTRGLALLTFAGEYNVANVAGEGTSLKAYWDSSYNLEGDRRAYKVFGVNKSFDADPFAWLVGVGYAFGTGKVQGDYALRVDYREIGLTSVDHNTSDSDFAFGRTNQRGFKGSVSYNVTDFANLNAAYFYTTRIQDKLTFAGANLDHSQTLQVDLVVKF